MSDTKPRKPGPVKEPPIYNVIPALPWEIRAAQLCIYSNSLTTADARELLAMCIDPNWPTE